MTKLFGTNGIRGVVNDDMNCEFALGIGQSWGTLLKKTIPKPRVVIGTDARLSNDMLKYSMTSGLLAIGCDVTDIGLVPTPCLQYTVKQKNFDSGVVITASHNPPNFNGIKGIDSDGTEFSKDIEEEIEKIFFERKYNLVNWKDVGNYSTWDKSLDLYINGIISNINVEAIKKQCYRVVVDCGNGAGCVVTPSFLKKLGCKIIKLNCTPDGTFPGRESEPIPENLSELINIVTKEKVDFGVAQDGDADRAIFIDEKGEYIWGDKTLALSAKYITKEKNGGLVVTPVTSSSCMEDVVRDNNGNVNYTKVGSPIVARVMIEKNAVFGGEENGGLIYPEMQYCRDSLMTIAKTMEIMAKEHKKLSELIDEIPKYYVYKKKIKCQNNKKETIMKKISNEIKEISDIVKIDETDGVKIYFEDGWVIIRPSGTEPFFRVFAESKKRETAEKIALKYKKLTEDIIDIS